MTTREPRDIMLRLDDNPIHPDWRPGERWWQLLDDAGEAVAMFRSEFHGRLYAVGMPSVEIWRIAVAVTEACLDWVTDSGECHFCVYNETQARHEGDCPLAVLDQAHLLAWLKRAARRTSKTRGEEANPSRRAELIADLLRDGHEVSHRPGDEPEFYCDIDDIPGYLRRVEQACRRTGFRGTRSAATKAPVARNGLWRGRK